MPGGPRTRTEKGRKVAGTRLRKLVCSDQCGYPPLRLSRAAISMGLPTCPCGAILWPWDLDDVGIAHDAGHLSDEQYSSHPLVQAYERECGSIAHGQAWDGSADTARLNDPSAGAAWRVAAAVRQESKSNQLAAARSARVEEPIPF